MLLAIPLIVYSGIARAQAPLQSRPRPPGALAGKTVFLSPGHGFYYHDTLGWITQRGNTNGLVEDFLNSELTCQFLAAYLENAGADVWTCRDRCFSTVEVIVDNGDPEYRETGAWLSTSSGGYGGDGRYAPASLQETATAIFTPNIPESGRYPLYLYFIAGTNRSGSVLIRIHHPGGTIETSVTQRRDGYTWRYVGTFYWLSSAVQSIEISNRSSSENLGRVVIADAIRIGGGIGSVEPTGGGPTSGRRRADEASVYWARYQGAPASVYNPTSSGDGTDDVTCRPLYAEFESEAGEDSVYLSIHSNGGGGTGTETYTYLDGTPPGSTELRELVHSEMVGDLRAGWDSGWVDRGEKAANFGELRLLSTMPGILIETAFHDNPGDAADEKQPLWRRIVARAIYQGIARYFGGPGAPLLPEPPTHLTARISGTRVRLSWRPPAGGGLAGGAGPPDGYRIYSSPNGFSFDGGTAAAGLTATTGPFRRGSTAFFRVTAVNEGGESFPTEVLGVRIPLSDGAPRVLIVSGYDRLDGDLNLTVTESPVLGAVDRQFLDRRMNSRDYVIEHLAALTSPPLDMAVESCSNESVEAGHVALPDYDAVDWFLGREEVADDTLNPAERQAIQDYLQGGGSLLLSGENIGTDLEENSSAEARWFFNTWLKARLATGDAETHSVVSSGAGSFSLQETFRLHDGSDPYYDVDRPDVYIAQGGAASALAYDGGIGDAGIQYSGSYRIIHLAFPLESVAIKGARDLLGRRGLAYLLEPPPPRPWIQTDPPEAIIQLQGGGASMTLDGSPSQSGSPGDGLAFHWRKLEGPAGDSIESGSSWESGVAGFGYGDGDDATLLDDMRGSYASVFFVREFTVTSSSAVQSLHLTIWYDDGFAAYLNGEEIARRNLPANAGYTGLALLAGEPLEESLDLSDRKGLLAAGRNVLAVEVHNASLDSSDLSFDAELVLGTSSRFERLVSPGSLWHFHRGRTPPPARWNSIDFDPAARSATVTFTRPGTYRYLLEVLDSFTGGEAEVTVTVLPERAGQFRRGDSDGSGATDITDAIFTLDWLFTGGRDPGCIDAADVNDGGEVDIADPIAILSWLFLGGTLPPPPGPLECGTDPTPDDLPSCMEFVCL